jgi:Kip1 ubiquitination-promoting complex protein 1
LGSDAVVNPDVIANVLNHVRHVSTQPAYVTCIAQDTPVAEALVRSFLLSFKGNNWVSTAELLPRFFRGRNFGQDACLHTMTLPLHDTPFDCTSSAMQTAVRAASMAELELTNTFLNHLLNHLNWTAAELSQVVDDIQTQQAAVAFNRDNEGRYRRGVLLFELEANLLRLLEAYVRVLPELFVGQTVDASTNRVRVLEAVLHVLNRAALGAQHTFLESQLLLNACHRDILLYACLGTLLALVDHDAGLVAEIGVNPQLKEEHLTYLSSEAFAHLPVSQRMSPPELESVQTLVAKLEPHVSARQAEIRRLLERQQRGSAGNDDVEEDEDNLCSICCATEQQCTFVPCQHRSCQMCINRHLKNSSKCFFCNAEIER